ncbi:hypothetical protein [Streptomyces sp. NPDC057638]|uniref:hypothetical protein n=1 Tax=Streptomyces sp. NPDC057638 TaxID=3346190 RepID=UPI00368E63C9
MTDHAPPTFTTYVNDGELVVLPASINTIRAALPEEQRDAFDTEIGEAHAEDLLTVLLRWAQETDPQVRAFQKGMFERLENGHAEGFISSEGLHALIGPTPGAS